MRREGQERAPWAEVLPLGLFVARIESSPPKDLKISLRTPLLVREPHFANNYLHSLALARVGLEFFLN